MNSELKGEADFVRRLQAADEDAWNELLDREGGVVWTHIRHFGVPDEDISDIRQEVFIAAVHAIGSFHGEARLRTWLFSIASARAVDWRRKQNRYKRIPRHLLTSIQKTGSDGSESEIELPSLLPDSFEALVAKVGPHWV